jgi:uncharacterized membrane protein
MPKRRRKKKPKLAVALRAQFLTGTLMVVPIAITIWVVVKVGGGLDNILGKYLTQYIGYRVPVLGFVLLIFALWLIGFLASNIFGRWLVSTGERFIMHLPIIKLIFSSVKQIMDSFLLSKSEAFRAVVLVQFPWAQSHCVGFVTSSDESTIGKSKTKHYHIFIPTAPNPTSGFLTIVPRDRVVFLDMSVEEGFKLVLSMGMVNPGKYKLKKPSKKEMEETGIKEALKGRR